MPDSLARNVGFRGHEINAILTLTEKHRVALLEAWMNISTKITDERVADVRCDADYLIVDLMDGRTISVPMAWYPRLVDATPAERANWQSAGGGYGIHWPDIDEDLSTEGLLRGAPASRQAAA